MRGDSDHTEAQIGKSGKQLALVVLARDADAAILRQSLVVSAWTVLMTACATNHAPSA